MEESLTDGGLKTLQNARLVRWNQSNQSRLGKSLLRSHVGFPKSPIFSTVFSLANKKEHKTLNILHCVCIVCVQK